MSKWKIPEGRSLEGKDLDSRAVILEKRKVINDWLLSGDVEIK